MARRRVAAAVLGVAVMVALLSSWRSSALMEAVAWCARPTECGLAQPRARPGEYVEDSACLRASALDAGACVVDASGSARCLPSMVLIGAMKAGTSQLMLLLMLHPHLATRVNWLGFPVETREAVLFQPAVSAASDEAYEADDWRLYLRNFPPASVDCDDGGAERALLGVRPAENATALGRRRLAGGGGGGGGGGAVAARRLVFDKSPNYLPSADVPARLARLVPSAQLVVTLRSPTARAYSHFQHICRRGDVAAAAPLPRGAHAEDAALWARRNISAGANRRGGGGSEARARLGAPCPPAAFDAWARAELAAARRTYGADGDPRWWAAWALAPTNAGPLTRGLYAPQLRRWLEHFPADHLTILLYEEWLDRDRPEATWEALAALQAKIGVRSFDYRSSVKRAVAQAAYAWFPSRSGYAPPLRETVDLLEAFYCDANTELAALLGRAPEEMPRQYACPGRE